MAMTEKLPDEIISDIVCQLPAKLVGQFRCISKKWCCFFSDLKFIRSHLTFHSNKHEQVKLILISDVSHSLYSLHFNPKHIQNGINAISTKLSFQEKWQRVVSSCNGLLQVLNKEEVTFFINPINLECRRILNNPLALPMHGTSTGYAPGYDIIADDYKVITLSYYGNVHEGDLFCTFVDVYSLRKDFWRRQESISHHDAIFIQNFGVFLNGALHWLAGKLFCSLSIIVSFDLSNEKFYEVSIDCTIITPLNLRFYDFMALKGCLYVLANRRDENEIEIWMMKEYGVVESWTQFRVIRKTLLFGPTLVYLMTDDDIVLDAPGEEKLIICNKKEEQWREKNVDGITAKFITTRIFMESLISPIIGKRIEGGDYILR